MDNSVLTEENTIINFLIFSLIFGAFYHQLFLDFYLFASSLISAMQIDTLLKKVCDFPIPSRDVTWRGKI
jgi:hypothetical protein